MGAAFVHLHPSGSAIERRLLPIPEYMFVFDAELYATSCTLQYATDPSPTGTPPGSKVVSLDIDNQAAISTASRPGCSYLSAAFAKPHPPCFFRGQQSNLKQGGTRSHTGITGNGLADAAAKLAAEGTPSDGFLR